MARFARTAWDSLKLVERANERVISEGTSKLQQGTSNAGPATSAEHTLNVPDLVLQAVGTMEANHWDKDTA